MTTMMMIMLMLLLMTIMMISAQLTAVYPFHLSMSTMVNAVER